MPRLLIIVREGCIETVAIEGLDGVEIELVKIDYDTEGADTDDGAMRVDGDLMFVDVGKVEQMTPDQAALARTARDTWRLA